MSKKLFVGNLPYSMTKEEMVALFADYGQIDDAVLIMDRMSGRSKGFGFVTVADDAMADKAIAELNGREMENNMQLKVDVAKPMGERPPRRGGFGGGGGRREGGFSRRDDDY
ncbi:RNA-binding protein [Candidatus Micrarchaeota archaeon CG10_big_fil_rev_8_21_14_0_10_45_29]|nr:MAG: RNA-binding protein [Candidatus Micrarchaeota archaeon CG10_big_fil_rev_8_21_14_0_10_45_29]